MLRTLAKKLPTPVKTQIKKFLNLRRRRGIAMGYYTKTLAIIDKWVWRDTETSNFYYKLTSFNRDHLAQLISSITDESYEKIVHYFDELENDRDLRDHLESALKGTHYGRDIEIDYGRRLGWYTFVRVLKPKIVVETGVDHGVGSCVLASALLRNAAEGHKGNYYGTEIRPEAGQLFCGKYATTGKILYDDSITSLEKLGEIDLFVNDSDHSGEYEYREYLAIASKLSDSAVILGDNSHVTDSLSRFSREQGRKFIFFSEKPEDHWYPGAGIGISYKQ
jgi:predicted O-methyltransferase YrrM